MQRKDAKLVYENGTYTIKLYSALADRGLSINRFMRETETDYSTFRRYANGVIQKIDLGLLDRWCGYLKCSPHDLVQYEPKPGR